MCAPPYDTTSRVLVQGLSLQPATYRSLGECKRQHANFTQTNLHRRMQRWGFHDRSAMGMSLESTAGGFGLGVTALFRCGTPPAHLHPPHSDAEYMYLRA